MVIDNETTLLDMVRTKLEQGHDRSRNTDQFQYTDKIIYLKWFPRIGFVCRLIDGAEVGSNLYWIGRKRSEQDLFKLSLNSDAD